MLQTRFNATVIKLLQTTNISRPRRLTLFSSAFSDHPTVRRKLQFLVIRIHMASTDHSYTDISERIRKDVRDVSTAPLLNYLVHFAKKRGDYSDLIHDSNSDDVWKAAKKRQSSLPDESKQLYEWLMNLIKNGPGHAVTPGTTVR